MFGADTALVLDAITIAGAALAAGAGGTWLVLRQRASRNAKTITQSRTGTLEQRVRVLERIATDQPRVLAEEIEALRDTPTGAN